MVSKAKDFTRGERQKEVTDKFRENYDKIFNKEKSPNNEAKKDDRKN